MRAVAYSLEREFHQLVVVGGDEYLPTGDERRTPRRHGPNWNLIGIGG